MPEIAPPQILRFVHPESPEHQPSELKWRAYELFKNLKDNASAVITSAEEDMMSAHCQNGTRIVLLFRHQPERELREQAAVTKDGFTRRHVSNGNVDERCAVVRALVDAFVEAGVADREHLDAIAPISDIEDAKDSIAGAPRVIWDFFLTVVETHPGVIVRHQHPLESRKWELEFEKGTRLKYEYQDLSPAETTGAFRKENVTIYDEDSVTRAASGGSPEGHRRVCEMLENFKQTKL